VPKGYSGDGGPALQATFNLPHELRFDAKGDLYIVDMTNHAVRKIDLKTKIITTIAGNGKPGYSGDGGPAKDAQFKQPHSIQFGPEGDLYVCDIGNHVIRKIDMKTGTISTFAGVGKAGRRRMARPSLARRSKGRVRSISTSRAISGSPRVKETRSSNSTSRPGRFITSPERAKAASPATVARPRRPRSAVRRAFPSMPRATCGSPTAKATASAW
jgi:hypothetical protein